MQDMNPQFEQSQGLHLPQPTESGSGRDVPMRQPEQAVPAQEVGPAPASPNPLYAAPPAPPASVPLPQDSATAQAVATATAAAANDDNDNPNVDLEWINKAKNIVDQTRSDPHQQSNELSKFKADYLKIRHNVTIKVTEDNRK